MKNDIFPLVVFAFCVAFFAGIINLCVSSYIEGYRDSQYIVASLRAKEMQYVVDRIEGNRKALKKAHEDCKGIFKVEYRLDHKFNKYIVPISWECSELR